MSSYFSSTKTNRHPVIYDADLCNFSFRGRKKIDLNQEFESTATEVLLGEDKRRRRVYSTGFLHLNFTTFAERTFETCVFNPRSCLQRKTWRLRKINVPNDRAKPFQEVR